MSKVSRNEQKKLYRKKQFEKKHFTEPIAEFLEAKYPGILEEYKELYQKIANVNGKRRIVMKTPQFKEWKLSVVQHTASRTVGTNTESTIQPVEVVQHTATRTVGTNTESTIQPVEVVQHSEIGIPSYEETSSAAQALIRDIEVTVPSEDGNETVRLDIDSLADIMANVEGQVDEIMAGLREDPFLRNVVEGVEDEVQRQNDEGIEMQEFDEIDIDIDSFDFEAEVDCYEW